MFEILSKILPPEHPFFVMLLQLVCPCLQENMRRNLHCEVMVLYLLRNSLCQNNSFIKFVFFCNDFGRAGRLAVGHATLRVHWIGVMKIWAPDGHSVISISEGTRVAHRHSSAIFHRRLGYRKDSHSGNQFCPKHASNFLRGQIVLNLCLTSRAQDCEKRPVNIFSKFWQLNRAQHFPETFRGVFWHFRFARVVWNLL